MMGGKRHRDIMNEKQFTIPQFVLHASATPVLERTPIKRELFGKSKVCLHRKDTRTLEMICPINGHRQPNALAGSSGFFGVPVELNGTGVCRCNSGGRTSSAMEVMYCHYHQRDDDKERVDLERQNLCRVPYVEDPEDGVRVLNLQKNNINRMSNLNHFNRLVCLDLYDNHLDKIEGLEMLHSLRVLILGKNRIKKIENLEGLTRLDMLDLHSNQISAIENLSRLTVLRVLNLSSNFVTKVGNLEGLESLVELNLRKNRVKSATGLDNLPSLEKLYLGSNKISKLEEISCILKCHILQELSLDYNPLYSKECNVKQVLLVSLRNLKVLDSKRVTEDQKKQADIWSKRDEEKRRENSKMVAFAQELNEKRFQAILNARKKWESSIRSTHSSMPSVYARHGASFHGNSIGSNRSSARSTSSGELEPRPPKPKIEAKPLREVSNLNSIAVPLRDGIVQNESPKGHREVLQGALQKHYSCVVNDNMDVQITEESTNECLVPDEGTTFDKSFDLNKIGNVIGSKNPQSVQSHSRRRKNSRSKSLSSGSCRDNGLAARDKGTDKFDQTDRFDKMDRSSTTVGSNQDSLSELEGETLKLFGSGSLDAFDRNWGIQAAGMVNEVVFNFIDFDEIVDALPKLRARFPNVCNLRFCSNNLSTLSQLNSLSVVKRLEGLTVMAEGNPITCLKSWRMFAIFRLSHLGLSRINGEELSAADCSTAEKMFSPLVSVASNSIPRLRLQLLLGDKKKLAEDKVGQPACQGQMKPLGNCENAEGIGKAILTYDPKTKLKSFLKDSVPKQSQGSSDRKAVAKQFLEAQVKYCLRVKDNLKTFESIWPELLKSSVSKLIDEMMPLKQYSESSFEEFCRNL